MVQDGQLQQTQEMVEVIKVQVVELGVDQQVLVHTTLTQVAEAEADYMYHNFHNLENLDIMEAEAEAVLGMQQLLLKEVQVEEVKAVDNKLKVLEVLLTQEEAEVQAEVVVVL